MKQKHKIVMLATDNAAPLMINKEELHYAKNYDFELFDVNRNLSHTNRQHLYIISYEEPIKGDWIYHVLDTKPIQYDGVFDNLIKYGYKKIIATTEILIINDGTIDGVLQNLPKGLPKIPQSFIEHYVKSYTEGKKIDEVFVEYENDKEYWGARNSFNPNSIDFKVYSLKDKEKYTGIMFDYYPIKLKLNQDNTIYIDIIKDSYTKSEVISIIFECLHSIGKGSFDREDLTKWIKENL